MAAQFPGSWTQVHDPVCGPDRLLVVLDHDQGVAQVPHPLKGPEQPLVVALMKTDGGLVQDIEDAHQLRSDLGCQSDPLGLAARESGRGAIQGQVIEAHVHHET